MSNQVSQVIPESEGKLSFLSKLGYGLGGGASNIIYQMITLYLLYFYTDVFGISGAVVGVLFLVARIWDAFNDPMMGYLADQTRSRWGKFRPYILFGALPLAAVYVLTFSTPNLPMTGKIVYAFVTYILLGMLYTLVNIPYNSMTAVLTQNPNERSSLVSFMLILSQVAVFIISVMTTPMVAAFPTKQAGFTFTTGIYAVLALIMFWVCFAVCKEKKIQTSSERYKLSSVFKIIRSNKFFLLLAIAYLLSSTAGVMRTASSIYYFKYIVGNEGFFPLFMVAILIASVVGSGIAPMFVKRMGSKRNLMFIGIAIFMVGDLGILLIPFSNMFAFFTSVILAGFGGGITMVLNWSMLPDTVEYGEWKTGIRSEGIIYSSFTFCAKLAGAIGGAISGALLAWSGYVPNAAQSPLVKAVILDMMALFPFIAGILGTIIIIFYKLDNKMFANIVKEIRERKEKSGRVEIEA